MVSTQSTVDLSGSRLRGAAAVHEHVAATAASGALTRAIVEAEAEARTPGAAPGALATARATAASAAATWSPTTPPTVAPIAPTLAPTVAPTDPTPAPTLAPTASALDPRGGALELAPGGAARLLRSARGELFTLTHVASDSAEVAAGRSYDGHVWEPVRAHHRFSGDAATDVTFACGAAAWCLVALNASRIWWLLLCC